jgi:hypothetical protein
MPRSRSTAIQSERTHHRSPRPFFARQLDRPAKQQQFLGQAGLAGVRVRNDRKSAPARKFVCQGTNQSASAIARIHLSKQEITNTSDQVLSGSNGSSIIIA